MKNALVLVTGGTGFVGSHCIATLLRNGYNVRTTVRSLDKAEAVRASIQRAGIDTGDRLDFVQADLMHDAGWAEAASGCDYVLHVASPLPHGHPKDENEVILPARDGALRVLRAARDAGVKRVVLTSSFAAIGYGHAQIARPFTEEDWTDPQVKGLSAYVKSKAIAERAAWDFIQREGGALELTALNPVAIFGPLLNDDLSGSITMITMELAGKMPLAPQISFGTVDVRDVAELHMQAMTHPQAASQRFLLVSGESITLLDIANILRAHLGAAAAKTPRRNMPNWLMYLFAIIRPEARAVLSELGKVKRLSNEKARRIFQWTPRTNEEAINATADSLVELGLVKASR